MAMHEAHRASLSTGDHRPCLLHERIAAVVEGDGMGYSRGQRGVAKLPTLGGVQRERLIRNDMLTCLERSHRNRKMKMVRRGVVNDRDVRIGDEVFVVSIGAIDLVFVRFSFGRLLRRTRNRDHIDIAQSSYRVNVVPGNKPGAYKTHANCLHESNLPIDDHLPSKSPSSSSGFRNANGSQLRELVLSPGNQRTVK